MVKIPKPSEMMRAKRPYLYSDSENTDAYRLSESELSHHLDTLTDRNQHKDFEVFARKLCEREICPNLRPQTGPEGGGDGKVDSESYPVDGKISERWFVGSARDGKEKWAFAVSAKQRWSPKVRSDVMGIAETKRGYDKIIFATNRPTRAKDRLRIEDELTKEYGIPVTILDREWIIDRVFSHNHKDLAFEYLKAGEHDPESVKLGPNDFKNQQALDEIEDDLKKMGSEPSDFTQAVSNAFQAANLSRRLERPRYETEGRFQRAIDYARKYGANYQELRAVYEYAWTRFWWFDDVQGMQDLYERVEDIAFDTDQAGHISKVCNLFQLIAGQIINRQNTAENLNFYARSGALRAKLDQMVSDSSRPNNSLYAETLLHFHDLNLKVLSGEHESIEETWIELSSVIDRTTGLGEYPAGLLDSMIDALSPLAPDSQHFDELVEKIAEFMSDRNQQLTAGETYLQHGQRKLDADRPIEAIKYLGRSVVNFMKEESREQQHRSLYMLAVAYRGAGLLWAARSASLAAIGQVSALSEETSEVRVGLVPSLALFAMVSLQSGNVSDFLAAIQYLNVLKEVLPLDEDSKAHLDEKTTEYDRLFSCMIVALNDIELRRLESIPDVLAHLGLFTARLTLLYRLGYQEDLYSEGTIPEDESRDALTEMMSMMAAQPASKDLPKSVVLLDKSYHTLTTAVLGVQVSISSSSGLQGYLFAEAHISYLEAFVSTFLNQGVFPVTEAFTVEIVQSGDAAKPAMKFKAEGSLLTVTIPENWDATSIEKHAEFMDHLTKFGAHFIGNALWMNDLEKTLEQVLGIERAFERATLFSRAGITRHRFFGSYGGTLSDWDQFVERSYPLLEDAPHVSPASQSEETDQGERSGPNLGNLNSHGDMSVNSIINRQLWDKACWSGMAYGCSPGQAPPLLALMFSDAESGKAIFREWRERFGKTDEKDEIRISLVEGIDQDHPYHYRGCVGQDLDAFETDPTKQIVFISRMNTMTVDNHDNLEMFLEERSEWGYYFLVPAIITPKGQPEFVTDLAIAKSKLNIRDAWEIGMHDIDAMGVRPDDKVIIPEGEENAPVVELQKWQKTKRL